MSGYVDSWKGVATERTLDEIKRAIENANGTLAKVQNIDSSGTEISQPIRSFAVLITRPANMNAYLANDTIADVSGLLTKIANVAKVNGSGIEVSRIRIQTNDTGFASAKLTVHFYSDDVTPIVDNDPFVISDANYTKREGSVSVVMGTGNKSKVGQNNWDTIYINPIDKDIRIVLETESAITPSANSTWVYIKLNVKLTN